MRPILSDEDANWLCEKYQGEHLTTIEIAEILGCQREIGEMYGVANTIIRDIWTGRRWSWLTGIVS